MTTVPRDRLQAPALPPEMTKDTAISGKGQVSTVPPFEGMGVEPEPATTGRGKAPNLGTPLIKAK